MDMSLVSFEQADAAARGEAHGEMWRKEIAELAQIRLDLALVRGDFSDRGQILRLAGLHLPELARVDEELSAEILGIARGADLSPELVVVLNHYTDLRDISAAVLGETAGETAPAEGADPGGCTALYVDGPTGPVLAQTWDMHGTAAPFVRMIRVAPEGSDREVVCFTLTGCVGMTGLNESGVGVTINNLTSTDAQVGLVWPVVVRRMLRARSADEARQTLMGTRLGSGHHYMMADAKDFFGVETSGQQKVLTQQGERTAHVHTNHCFDPVLRGVEKVSQLSTTFRRMELATTAYAQQRPRSAQEVWDFLSSHEGYPKSICSHVDDESGDPSFSRTCGLMVMQLVGGKIWACRGCAHENPKREFSMQNWRGAMAPAR
jgi:isopenicillin-N N-acyltransferase-like protein